MASYTANTLIKGRLERHMNHPNHVSNKLLRLEQLHISYSLKLSSIHAGQSVGLENPCPTSILALLVMRCAASDVAQLLGTGNIRLIRHLVHTPDPSE